MFSSSEHGCLSFMDPKRRHKKELIFGSDESDGYRKTVLLLGTKGSGKTSLINSFANFVNNVSANAPYRLHITPLDDKSTATSMKYEATQSVCTYVFQNTPLGFSVAIVDTPALGNLDKEGKEADPPTLSTMDKIRRWYDTDYVRPVEDLEIWLVISAVDSKVSVQMSDEVRAILDDIEWKVRVIPVITFAKRRRPILALKALEELGFRCQREGVDYFTINNGSMLGLSTDLLETNALTFDESVANLRNLLISHYEPILPPDLDTLHISNMSDTASSPCSKGRSSASSIHSPPSSSVDELDSGYNEHHSRESSYIRTTPARIKKEKSHSLSIEDHSPPGSILARKRTSVPDKKETNRKWNLVPRSPSGSFLNESEGQTYTARPPAMLDPNVAFVSISAYETLV